MSMEYFVAGPPKPDVRSRIQAFCEQLTATVLSQLDNGANVLIDIKHFYENDYVSSGIIVDRRFRGIQWTIKIDPALAPRAESAREPDL